MSFQEPGKGELGALSGIPCAPVKPSLAEMRLFDGDHFNWKCGMFQYRMPADLVGKILTGIITHKDLELWKHFSTLGNKRSFP